MSLSLSVLTKSLTQLPLSETLNYVIYQFILRSGIIRFTTPLRSKNQALDENLFAPQWFNFLNSELHIIPERINTDEIIQRADLITNDQIMLFGSILSGLDLYSGTPLAHWSNHPALSSVREKEDIKFIWEPARFGWGIHLGQAFFITRDEKYAQYFWSSVDNFNEKNPINLGPNWSSAQEVALRMIAWIAAIHLFKPSKRSTPQAITQLSKSVADHASRITATLSYARAQNNNHLLSEAAGLYTAGTFLPYHPQAEKWRTLGKRIFENAILRQINANGEYVQHSTNYHRMMLTLSLWMKNLLVINQDDFSQEALTKIKTSVTWLWSLMDDHSGAVPNLGHNDGSLILPYSTAPYSDYRPTLQACANAFLSQSLFPAGEYDDLALWLGIRKKNEQKADLEPNFSIPRIGNNTSWAVLRAAKYHSRPAHADQLHVDLWYQGVNVLLDAGTYQYNLRQPWNNGLSKTCVHNTISIQNTDQMTRAGRFLWLDWAQAHISENSQNKVIAAHDGYLNLGAVHERTLIMKSEKNWQVIDHLYKMKAAKDAIPFDLHWLVPDWEFEILENGVKLHAPFGALRISVANKTANAKTDLVIFRGGVSVNKKETERPLLGWYSPTYGVKLPALSILFKFNQKLPAILTTDLVFY